MIVLGIDTSAIVCSCAIVKDGKTLCQCTRNDGLTHSETLLPMIRDLLLEAKLSLADLDAISVSCGPGSFTGLRIGISTVKGLAVSDRIPCVPVSTLEGLAWNARDCEGDTICCLMDARRGEFYHALFCIENGRPFRLRDDCAVSGDEIASTLANVGNLILLGDGADKFVSMFPEFARSLAPDSKKLQSGASVAHLGSLLVSKGTVTDCDALSPNYLRIPQAEREWNKKQNL